MENNAKNTIKELHLLIDKFKNRSDVINGKAIGWKGQNNEPIGFDRPISVGDGLTTTGWCVSASEALLNDKIFADYVNINGGRAKLISIDIKEQYYGYVYNGSQNKWHTAILLLLNDMYYVIDLTCGQFGNDYVNKNIWTLDAWTQTFRSAVDTHVITDFFDNVINVVPLNYNHNEFKGVNNNLLLAKYNLKNFTNIDEHEREALINFYGNFTEINNRMLSGKVTPEEKKFVETIIDIYHRKIYQEYTISKAFSVLLFESKSAAINWINLHSGINHAPNGEYIDFVLKQNILLFESVEKAREFYDLGILNSDGVNKNKYELIVEFNDVIGYKNFSKIVSYIMFAGTELTIFNDQSSFMKINDNASKVIIQG